MVDLLFPARGEFKDWKTLLTLYHSSTVNCIDNIVELEYFGTKMIVRFLLYKMYKNKINVLKERRWKSAEILKF